MDCKTARLLLEFARPEYAEIEAEEAAALEGHLVACSECDTAARAERQVDSRIGAAMRAVPIPEGLRARILNRLVDDRNRRQRRWAARGAAAFALAASIFLAIWFLFHLGRPVPDTDDLAQNTLAQTAGNADMVRVWFKERGHINVVPPPDFDYRLLASCSMIEHKGQRVPLLVFVKNNTYYAHVYVLSDRDFNLGVLNDRDESHGPIRMTRKDGPAGVVYLIFYNSERLEDFYAPAGAAGNLS